MSITTRRATAMIGILLLAIVPTPACSQCTTCNQQPSQVYYNSQTAIQPSNQARPGQFQPPTSVSRNQQIYVWYGQPQPMQNQNGAQPQQQYNPNGGYNPNNQQPVMYNNINRDQPNYANQQFNPNPNAQQPSPSNDFSMQPNPSASNQFQPQTRQPSQISPQQPQSGYNPALVTSQTAPIGYNPAGQPQYGQPSSTQFTSPPSTQYPQSTTPYGSQYPITGTPVNAGAIGVNNMQGSTQYNPSTTPSPQQPFYSSTQPQYTTTVPTVYQIGQGIPGNTVNPQLQPGASASTYSPYAVGGSTLGTQVLYDPSTGLSTANGMNTMYGRYTTMEPGSQMMRDVPFNGGTSLSLMAGIAALVFIF